MTSHPRETTHASPDIILVEDRESDAELVRQWLSDSYDVEIVTDGGRAISRLRSFESASAAPRLVLLDLKLPRWNGLDVLAAARMERTLESTRFVVLTDSQSPVDRRQATAMGADRFETKPMDVDDFRSVIEDIEESLRRAHDHG